MGEEPASVPEGFAVMGSDDVTTGGMASLDAVGRLWRLLLPLAVVFCFSGCLSRTAAPQLPYVQPANSVPRVDPAPLQIASRMQDIESELQRLRDNLERLQAKGGDELAVKHLQERVSFIERQLGIEQASMPPASPGSPGQSPPRQVAAPVPSAEQAPPARRTVPDTIEDRGSGEVDVRSTPLSPEEKSYRDAYSTFRNGGHDQAVQMFEDFVKRHPKSEFASSAVYWMGEARFAQGRFDDAVLLFDRVIKEFPGSKKELNSLLKQGESFEKMGDARSARIIFQKIISEYPHTAQGRLASARLKSLPQN